MLLFIRPPQHQATVPHSISKHLMLLFIAIDPIVSLKSPAFQNISCYCLSCFTVFVFFIQSSFQNISCYCLSLKILSIQQQIPQFQNISCYCLSFFKSSISHGFPSFQNISCYCLSKRRYYNGKVTLKFQNISCYCLSIIANVCKFVCDISKHLMLLFIVGVINDANPTSRFQNISCYCLSLAFPRFLVSPLPFFPLYFLYFSIFYQPTPLSWTALLIIP